MKRTAALALAVTLISALLLAINLRAAPLYNCDEALYAAVARNMAADGGYFRMTLNGLPYYDKPPLVFWLTAALGKLTGDSEFAIRWVMVAAGGAVAGLTFLLATLTAETRRAGFGAVAALFALKDFPVFARIGMMDMPLTAFVGAAILGFLLLARDAKPAGWLIALAALSISAAVLTKYVIGLLPLAVAAPLWLRYPAARRRLLLAAGLGLAVPALYFAGQLALHGRPYWDGFLFRHAGHNFVAQHGGETLPWWFYFEYLAGTRSLPITAAAVAGCFVFRGAPAGRAVFLIWFLLPLLVFSAAPTRFAWYLVVTMPALAVAGGWFVAALGRRWRSLAVAIVALWCVFGAANLFNRYTIRAPLSVAMKELCAVVVRDWRPGDRIILYRQMAITADQAYYYLDRRVLELAETIGTGSRTWVFVFKADESSVTFPSRIVTTTTRGAYDLYLIQ